MLELLVDGEVSVDVYVDDSVVCVEVHDVDGGTGEVFDIVALAYRGNLLV